MSGKKITELISGSIDNLPLSGVTAIIYSGTTFQHNLTHLRQTLVDSGSHHFTGSQNINGSLIVSGTGSIRDYMSVGKYENPNVGGPESLRVENSSSINVARFYGDHQNYTQINLTNKNSGSNASGDIVITADNGNESVHFIDLGINTSTYQGGFVGRENDAYLLNVGKDMYIGTIGGVNHPSKLFLFGQNSWENPQITVSGSGQVSFNTCSCDPGYTYQFSGSAKFQNNLDVVGSTTASYFVGDGSQLTNLPIQTTDVSMFLSSSTFTSASASFDSRIISATNEQDLSYFATTGSNTFVGNQIVSGTLYIATNSGDEGGEITLGKALTNTTIAGNNVILDVFRDRVRIFEEGGSSRGAFLNVVSQSANVNSEIVTSPNLFSIQTITSASYASITPVSGTLYIIID
jgi:hypothetical protein